MTTDQIIAEAVDAQSRERRYGRFESYVLIALAALVGLFLLVAVPALQRQSELRDLGQQNVCIARVTAEAIAAFGEAVAAPPAPNPQRDAAVEQIARSARRLHHVDDLCPGP